LLPEQIARLQGTVSLIKIRVTPNAPKDQVLGYFGEELRVKVKAPAVEGKANFALIRYLSRLTGIDAANIRIKVGEKSRIKLVEFAGIGGQELRSRLGL
jgi:uncharacterized protein (TIGR00251 family)